METQHRVPIVLWLIPTIFVMSIAYFGVMVKLGMLKAGSLMGERGYLDVLAPALVATAAYLWAARRDSLSIPQHLIAAPMAIGVAPFLGFWALIYGWILVVGE